MLPVASRGTVRTWSDEEGWGVLDLAETAGGCWAHYSAVQVDGYKRLQAGQDVDVEWEPARQDGFAYRATRVWPTDATRSTEPEPPLDSSTDPSAAYGSNLTLTVNGPQVSIDAMNVGHWPEVRAIYAAGIATGHATFESEPPSWERFDEARLPDHRLVAVAASHGVLGWVAVSPASERCMYAGVVQHAVYVDPSASGRGIGRVLLEHLAGSTESAGIWTIQSGIFPENTASLAVHAAAGFRVVGVRERLGKMTYGPLAGRWRDVVAVERRSPRIS